jgi:hypothetical protein
MRFCKTNPKRWWRFTKRGQPHADGGFTKRTRLGGEAAFLQNEPILGPLGACKTKPSRNPGQTRLPPHVRGVFTKRTHSQAASAPTKRSQVEIRADAAAARVPGVAARAATEKDSPTLKVARKTGSRRRIGCQVAQRIEKKLIAGV